MKDKPHEKIKDLVVATTTDDLQKTSSILETILDDKLKDRLNAARKALEES